LSGELRIRSGANLKGMNKNLPLIAIAAIIIIGGLAFFGGLKYGEGKASASNQVAGQPFNGGQVAGANNGTVRGAGRARGGLTSGQITNVQGDNITLQMSDGTTKTVSLSASTVISKLATTTTADLSVGETVSVTGAAASDGSVAAQSIQIRPAGSQFPGGGQAANGGGQTPGSGQVPNGQTPPVPQN